jgi:hypothetical protein
LLRILWYIYLNKTNSDIYLSINKVLLSHRYGSRPIPAQISASLFELLKSTVLTEQNENNDGELLTQWYQLDTNCVPAAYILQNIASILPKFTSKVNERIFICMTHNLKRGYTHEISITAENLPRR